MEINKKEIIVLRDAIRRADQQVLDSMKIIKSNEGVKSLKANRKEFKEIYKKLAGGILDDTL